MSRRVLAAIAATTWLAGCVSILGVDDGDHVDVQTVVCECTDGAAQKAACSGALGTILRKRPRLEDAILGCVEEHGNKCAALDGCLLDEEVCIETGRPCTPAGENTQLALRCCEGTCGDDGACGIACADPGQPCGGTATCCNGLACVDDVCPSCASVNEPCAPETPCCGAANPLVCGDETGTCLECEDRPLGRCSANFPCCATGTCDIPDGLEQGVCPDL